MTDYWSFTDEELAQLFHWLEELGVAIRNCWRHEQLAATHGLIDDILAGLGSACVVVGSNCGVLHANTGQITHNQFPLAHAAGFEIGGNIAQFGCDPFFGDCALPVHEIGGTLTARCPIGRASDHR